jgi:hypothetical protein
MKQKEMFILMLHELKLRNMKQKGNVYLNVTWIETKKYEARSKCLCECYMNLNFRIWSKKEMFIWMLHELKPLNMKQKGNVYVIWSKEQTFMWMLHELKLRNMKQKGNVYLNVTWIETKKYEAKSKCLCECYELKLLNMKQKANVYVNVTWIETIEYEAKSICSSECYMNWYHWIWS